MRGTLLAIALACAGCLKTATFQCDSASQCVRDGVQGACEPVGFCSFPDTRCTSGARFGDYAGANSNKCVGAEGDGGVGDGTPHGCPVGYDLLPGVPDHKYKKLLTAAAWMNHQTACASEGSNIYITVPDDATELTALVTLAGADVWVGIDDMSIEGTFQTVRNVPATFLPWAPGEPDNGGNQDCVEILMASSQLATLGCSQPRIAICECEP